MSHAASSLIIAPWLHGGPVVLRPARSTPCCLDYDVNKIAQSDMMDDVFHLIFMMFILLLWLIFLCNLTFLQSFKA